MGGRPDGPRGAAHRRVRQGGGEVRLRAAGRRGRVPQGVRGPEGLRRGRVRGRGPHEDGRTAGPGARRRPQRELSGPIVGDFPSWIALPCRSILPRMHDIEVIGRVAAALLLAAPFAAAAQTAGPSAWSSFRTPAGDYGWRSPDGAAELEISKPAKATDMAAFVDQAADVAVRGLGPVV